jgi:2-C-methyl-D-erythritol 4-phosphate cytidylyltransferase
VGKLGVVIVAAGRGSRMGTSESKQYLMLQEKPIIAHTLEVFEQAAWVDGVWLIVGEHDVSRCEAWIQTYGFQKVIQVIPGGHERQHSVYKGLCCIPEGYEWVMVHDGVRPFVKESAMLNCWDQAKRHGSAVLAVPVKDTVKIVDEAGMIQSTPDRKSLWAVQTPQAFRLCELIEAHKAAQREGRIGTDDAMLMEQQGFAVAVAEGDYSNIKITTPEDLHWAARYLEEKKGEQADDKSGTGL